MEGVLRPLLCFRGTSLGIGTQALQRLFFESPHWQSARQAIAIALPMIKQITTGFPNDQRRYAVPNTKDAIPAMPNIPATTVLKFVRGQSCRKKKIATTSIGIAAAKHCNATRCFSWRSGLVASCVTATNDAAAAPEYNQLSAFLTRVFESITPNFYHAFSHADTAKRYRIIDRSRRTRDAIMSAAGHGEAGLARFPF